jgi:multiple sugar transport system ATP-binding protein
MAEVVFDDIGKVYPDGTRAVSDLELTVDDGELVVLVGPSGCGKTTALRMVAGLEEITDGVLRIGDREMNHVPARDRDIAMVFQSYALYPHLTVRDNIAFSLKIRREPKDEIGARVERAARTLGLEELLDRKPRALSGGQRQRVAMGRAIVREPQAFLMDEPLSNLDAKLRVQMRAEIAEIQARLEVTTIYVTHDQTEAMTMGDRVAVMRGGRLQQVAAPQDLYDHPVNLFVAGFIGSPAMNFLRGRLVSTRDAFCLELGSERLPVPREVLSARPALRAFEGKELIVGIRPEDMEDGELASDRDAAGLIPAEVVLREALGSEIVIHATVDADEPETEAVEELARDAGARRDAAADRGGTRVVARFGARSRAAEGDRIHIAVDTTALHFFDPDTNSGIYDDSESEEGS